MLKYWKGSHIILKREVCLVLLYSIYRSLTLWINLWIILIFHMQDLLKEYQEKIRNRPPDYAIVDPNCLKWTPPDQREETS